MRSLFENKRLILFLAVLALGALTVLAISLNQVPFREGQRFVREAAEQVPLPPPDPALVYGDVPLWKQLVVWLSILLLVALIGLLLSPEGRKRMILLLIRIGFTVWALYYLFTNYGADLLGLNLERPDGGALDNGTVLPMPTFAPPDVSPTISYVISFAFALLLLAVLSLLYRGWRRYAALNREPLEEIARIARSSLNDLSSGRNSSDVIINCYLRMSDVVSDKRHLYRAAAMTPHEFALRLEQAGLPGDAVTRLTRLFEGVRYGDRKSGPKDVNEAVSCLKTILTYCGEPV
jgi:hypothetical protein